METMRINKSQAAEDGDLFMSDVYFGVCLKIEYREIRWFVFVPYLNEYFRVYLIFRHAHMCIIYIYIILFV